MSDTNIRERDLEKIKRFDYEKYDFSKLRLGGPPIVVGNLPRATEARRAITRKLEELGNKALLPEDFYLRKARLIAGVHNRKHPRRNTRVAALPTEDGAELHVVRKRVTR